MRRNGVLDLNLENGEMVVSVKRKRGMVVE
jgi:hypothetical protein